MDAQMEAAYKLIKETARQIEQGDTDCQIVSGILYAVLGSMHSPDSLEYLAGIMWAFINGEVMRITSPLN